MRITWVTTRLCHQISFVCKQTGINKANLISLTSRGSYNVPYVTRSSPDPRAMFALINVRSIRSKALLVRDYVRTGRSRLDGDMSWRKRDNCRDRTLRRGLLVRKQPRSSARGDCGVGLLFRKTLQLVSYSDIDTQVCETCCIILRNIRIGCTA